MRGGRRPAAPPGSGPADRSPGRTRSGARGRAGGRTRRGSARGWLPTNARWWTSARAITRSGRPRSKIEARSRFIQPDAGLGLNRSSTSGRSRVSPRLAGLEIDPLDAGRVEIEGDRRGAEPGGHPAEMARCWRPGPRRSPAGSAPATRRPAGPCGRMPPRCRGSPGRTRPSHRPTGRHRSFADRRFQAVDQAHQGVAAHRHPSGAVGYGSAGGTWARWSRSCRRRCMARPQRTHERAGSSRTARSSGMPSILVRQSWLSR